MRAFTALLMLALTFTSPALAAEPMVSGWQISQSAREPGPCIVEATKTALRITTVKSNLVVLAVAPWKEVSVFCQKTGNVCKVKAADFTNPYLKTLRLFDGGSIADLKMNLKGKTKCIGLDGTLYVEKPGYTQRQIARYRSGHIGLHTPATFEYVTTDSLHLPPELGQIMARFYALPDVEGVPLQFTSTNVKNEPEKELTVSSVKPAQFKASDFKLPTGLKAVKEEISVLVPDSEESGLDLMMMGRTKTK